MILSILVWFIAPLLLIIIFNALSDLHWIPDNVHFAATAIFVIIVVIALMATPLTRFDVSGKIRGLEAVRESVNLTRENNKISSIELAALSTKILEYNRWLGNVQYWASLPSFRVFFPKSLYSIEPIR